MAKPFQYPNLTVIIPFRGGAPERYTNLCRTVTYLTQHVRPLRIYIVEYAERIQYTNTILDPTVRWIFAQCEPGELFSKSRAINMALPHIVTPFTATWDADAILNPDAVKRAVGLLLEGVKLVVPFMHAHWLYPENAWTRSFVNRGNEFFEPEPGEGLYADCTCGLVNLFDTKTLRHVRGFNELIVGWGHEDEEIISRFMLLGLECRKIDSVAVHMWHPEAARKHAFSERTHAEFYSLIFKTAEQVRGYYGIAEDVGRHSAIRTLPHSGERTKDTPGLGPNKPSVVIDTGQKTPVL